MPFIGNLTTCVTDSIRLIAEAAREYGDIILLLKRPFRVYLLNHPDYIRDFFVTLIAAGHETTADALTWTWYLLSEHPEVERKLHEELGSALNGGTPTVDHLPKLSYTGQVLTEAMRLYPPSWAISRKAVNDVQIGDYWIPKGSYVLVSQYAMHRDPRWFLDPFEL